MRQGTNDSKQGQHERDSGSRRLGASKSAFQLVEVAVVVVVLLVLLEPVIATSESSWMNSLPALFPVFLTSLLQRITSKHNCKFAAPKPPTPELLTVGCL